MMPYCEWDTEDSKVIAFLDSIDLRAEMINDEELSDFMDRLENKYEYTTEYAASLFDYFGTDDFLDYLFKRYNSSCTYRVTKTYMQKWAIEA